MTAAVDSPVLAPLRWWDLDQVVGIEEDLFGPDAWRPAQFWAELARIPETRWYVAARAGEQVVGYAGMFLVGPEADVQTVAVARSAQGHGVGRRLVGALVDEARARGATVLHLEVRADNGPALGLYEELGFTADGRRRDYYGRGRDAVLMSRPVSGGPDG